jgi:hypothetical protein
MLHGIGLQVTLASKHPLTSTIVLTKDHVTSGLFSSSGVGPSGFECEKHSVEQMSMF